MLGEVYRAFQVYRSRADYDVATHVSIECAYRGFHIFLAVGLGINDCIKGFALQLCDEICSILTIALNMLNLIPPFGLGGPSGKDGDLVPALKQSLYNNPTHVPCATDDKNVHINKSFL